MERAIFFIDARNILGGQNKHRQITDPNYTVGYAEIIDYLRKDYRVIRGYYYDGAPHHTQRTSEKMRFFDFLREKGITLRLKEIDFNQPHPSQKGVDIFLATDMISLAYEDAYDVAFLLSGDGDYVALVDLVKSKGKRVIVMTFQNCISKNLRECADKIVFFENTPELSRKIRTPFRTPVV